VSEGIAVDQPGRAVVAGFTCSDDFPTRNPLQPALAGGTDDFVAQFAADGMTLRYSTYGGGSAAFRKNEQGPPCSGLERRPQGRPPAALYKDAMQADDMHSSSLWVEALRKPSPHSAEALRVSLLLPILTNGYYVV
jgi:hypothetical protein